MRSQSRRWPRVCQSTVDTVALRPRASLPCLKVGRQAPWFLETVTYRAPGRLLDGSGASRWTRTGGPIAYCLRRSHAIDRAVRQGVQSINPYGSRRLGPADAPPAADRAAGVLQPCLTRHRRRLDPDVSIRQLKPTTSCSFPGGLAGPIVLTAGRNKRGRSLFVYRISEHCKHDL
jgi:hypothetical protein